jgi:potassium efflux system protein
MQALRSLALGLIRAATWPLYLILLAYAARVAPWPRSLGILVSAVATGGAIAIFVYDLIRWLMGPSGWPERTFGLPAAVARQLSSSARFLVVTSVAFLLPVYLFDHELIAPEGKPILAPATGRLLVLAYELLVWGTCVRLLRGGSPLLEWLSLPSEPSESGDAPPASPPLPSEAALRERLILGPRTLSAWAYASLVWIGRRRRTVAALVLAAIAGIVALDFRGYSFTARRLAIGGLETGLALVVAVTLYRAISHLIGRNASQWTGPTHNWAMALTSAMVLRSRMLSRSGSTGLSASPPHASPDDADEADNRLWDDLAIGLKRLAAYSIAALTFLAIASIWEVDMALLQLLLNKQLWPVDSQSQTWVTVGDVTKASVVLLMGALSWRYMNALFAVTIFPKMPDDPGVRFAVVTLCRYVVLGLTGLIALAAVHLDLAKIGVVLAALGVGLGFGLQEIVSNFVCGIILLLERPMRIGDIVTVAGTTGKVDRINIRATTIINGDNQSMIVPNREFITGNLVNWTLKDKILRVSIKINVAYGSDPDRVVDLLARIARADADVMINPAPSASLEGFGDSSLQFALYTFVPEPALAGNVRHRLCSEIQRRFSQEGFVIPFPTQELHVNNKAAGDLLLAVESPPVNASTAPPIRFDVAAKNPPTPHVAGTPPATTSLQEEPSRTGSHS